MIGDELAEIMRATLIESLLEHDRKAVDGGLQIEDCDDRALEREVREHFLDRWYRFAAFGVESRADLHKLRVEVTWEQEPMPPEWVGRYDGGPTRNATVIVLGTPLERHAI